MNEKLSSKKIKQLIEAWLSSPYAKERISHFVDFDRYDEKTRKELLKNTAEWFKYKLDCTPEELLEHIYGLWCDGNQWKRDSKRKMSEDWETYFSDYDYSQVKDFKPGDRVPKKPYCPVDMMGDYDVELVTKYFNDPESAKRCIHRIFVPNNALDDNYRLEVITTPEDDAVVGWTVVED